MKILVTGASGFIGSHVARHLVRAGHQVTGIGHGPANDWRADGLAGWIEASISLEALDTVTGPIDSIIHCAGGSSVGASIEDPRLDFDRTVVSTSAVLEHIRLCSPATRLVYLSSAAVYGNAGADAITEDTPYRPVSPYGVHKQMAEQLCALYASQYGIGATIIRFFSVFGEGLKKQLLWDACNKMTTGDCSFFGSGDEVRDWLHVDDAASLIERLLKTPAGSPLTIVNGGRGQGVQIRAVLDIVRQALGVDQALTFSQQKKAGDPDFFIANAERALATGWRPRVDLAEGVRRYCHWFQEERS